MFIGVGIVSLGRDDVCHHTDAAAAVSTAMMAISEKLRRHY